MSSFPGRRVGLAVLRIELEDAVADRVVIRVQTVCDVAADRKQSHERSFAVREDALAYLGEWLAGWPPEPAES